MPTQKKKGKQRLWLGAYGRGWAGIPTLLAAASWPAIWLLWPAPTPLAPRRQPTTTQLALAAPAEWILAEPATVFASPWEKGRLTEENDIPALTAFEFQLGEPAGLTREPTPPAWPLLRDARPRASARRHLGPHPHSQPLSFRPLEDDERPSVVVRFSQTLNAKAFRLPAAARDALNAYDGAGTLVLLVDIGPEGKPDAVFVEHSSGDRAFDNAAVHAVYQGQTSTGTPGFGRIFISRPAS